jgi:hypothetical protein
VGLPAVKQNRLLSKKTEAGGLVVGVFKWRKRKRAALVVKIRLGACLFFLERKKVRKPPLALPPGCHV